MNATYDTGPDCQLIEIKEENDLIGLVLHGDYGIAQASTLHSELLNILSMDKNMSIDCGAVESIDTAIWQVLIAFLGEAKNQGLTLKWGEVSEPVRQVANVLGLAGYLETEH